LTKNIFKISFLKNIENETYWIDLVNRVNLSNPRPRSRNRDNLKEKNRNKL